MGCHALLQGIFPTQGSNPGLLHCRGILYHLSHQGSPSPTREALPQPGKPFPNQGSPQLNQPPDPAEKLGETLLKSRVTMEPQHQEHCQGLGGVSGLWVAREEGLHTLRAWICSGSESMKRSPMGSQVARTPSAWVRVAFNSSIAPWISNSCSRVRSMWRCWSTQRAVNFSQSSLATVACFHTKRLRFWIRCLGEVSARAVIKSGQASQARVAHRKTKTAFCKQVCAVCVFIHTQIHTFYG